MGKYEPLERFLRNQTSDEVTVTFGDIEQIVGFKLPPSRLNRAWWSNNPTNNVMTRAWLDADFVTEKVDIKNQRLVFRRLASAKDAADQRPDNPSNSSGDLPDHPLLGWMKGTVTIPEGVDLTEPADPDWADFIDEKYPVAS